MGSPIYTSGVIEVRHSALGDRAEQGSSFGFTNDFIVSGTDSATEAANVMRAYVVDVLDRDPSLFRIAAEHVAPKRCRASIDFGYTNLSPVSFSTTGGSTHLNQSYATRGTYTSGGTAPDYGGAIGVSESGVAGCDVTVPAFNFNIRKRFEFVSTSYLLLIVALTGKTNADAWQIFAPGEVLFLGADGSEDSENYVDLTYQFAVRGNENDLTIGGISGIVKRGWDHVWVKHDETITGDRVLQTPAAVYVEEVYPSAMFAGLGLNS